MPTEYPEDAPRPVTALPWYLAEGTDDDDSPPSPEEQPHVTADQSRSRETIDLTTTTSLGRPKCQKSAILANPPKAPCNTPQSTTRTDMTEDSQLNEKIAEAPRGV